MSGLRILIASSLALFFVALVADAYVDMRWSNSAWLVSVLSCGLALLGIIVAIVLAATQVALG